MLAPKVLEKADMELIFDTIVNERVDNVGFSTYGEPGAAITSSLSFEEFKKSIVRIASICSVFTSKQRVDPD